MLFVTHSLFYRIVNKTTARTRKGLRVGSRVVAIEVLVHVEDQVGNGAIWISDLVQCVGRSIGDKGGCRSPVVPREQYHLSSCSMMNRVRKTLSVWQYDFLIHPAFRIAVTAACTDPAHKVMSGISWGSFMLQ